MNATDATRPPPLYALIDRRRDGRPRIVSEHVSPDSARLAADLLRWSGAAEIEVVLITAIIDEAV